jgi:hypothetical protein
VLGSEVTSFLRRASRGQILFTGASLEFLANLGDCQLSGKTPLCTVSVSVPILALYASNTFRKSQGLVINVLAEYRHSILGVSLWNCLFIL